MPKRQPFFSLNILYIPLHLPTVIFSLKASPASEMPDPWLLDEETQERRKLFESFARSWPRLYKLVLHVWEDGDMKTWKIVL